ncbi:MAG: gamma-glutamylcyclotransferase, partial [Armatimonadetes bacterium]|nr:gamma-glutamylcyclotransferase [Armatimonadota bacterium]
MCIKIVVYGSLKRGFWNHEIYCSEAVSIERATVRGRLYELPSGIPVLEVLEQDIIAHGSVDILG